jgi:gas vesicle protein
MLSTFWEWLQTASQGQATFVGALTGSFLGLVALLLGALFNGRLNRKRDDRLRREDQRAVASALRAELEGVQRVLKHQAETMRQEDYAKPDEEINVPDLGQSIRIMPEAISKLGLLDGKTIGAVVTAYEMAEEYSAKLLFLGGRPRVTPDNFRRYVVLPSNRVTQVAQLNDVTAGAIQEALDQLATTRPWREMTWRERWRWLRTPA